MSAWHFYVDRGLVWVRLEPERTAFNEALNDGVSSLAPRGQESALSTYWIDGALSRLDGGPGGVVTGGNVTHILRTAGGVEAHSDYEVFDPDEMPLDEFAEGLKAWREEVVKRLSVGPVLLPDQAPYQRNPR